MCFLKFVSVPRAIPAQENIYDEEGPSSTPSTTADDPHSEMSHICNNHSRQEQINHRICTDRALHMKGRMGSTLCFVAVNMQIKDKLWFHLSGISEV